MAEKVILIGLRTDDNHLTFDESFKELEALADSAGAEVVMTLEQKLNKADSKTYIGKGKLEELKKYVDEYKVDAVIFNNELSGSQLKNIDELLDVKVVDRTQLILDIFASRAKSDEAKLQVSLAQENYRLPRLTGLRANLSKLAGGIGTRGPGEQKLEMDKRHIRRKMTIIKERLKKKDAHRNLNMKNREKANLPIVSLFGYTNAGKSTIMNRLLEKSGKGEDKKVYADDRVFATLETSNRRIYIKGRLPFILSDTVGLISDIPIDLIEAFKATLEEAKGSDLILIVLDASSDNLDMQLEVIKDTINELKMGDIPTQFIYNKIDKKVDFLFGSKNDAIYVSALTEEGLDKIIDTIDNRLKMMLVKKDLLIPYTEQKLYARLKENFNPSVVEEERGWKVAVYLPSYQAKELKIYEVDNG